MQNCGPQFHAEVGKFRFLNELIKLISPKYLGSLTPDAVRTEIIELLYLWTREYPIETKIREAYEMLKKQRVVQVSLGIYPLRPNLGSVFQVEFFLNFIVKVKKKKVK